MTGPISFPVKRGVKQDRVHMLDWGGQLRPPLGGPVQNIMRLGTRHAIDITIPIMRAEPEGRIWASRLRQAKLYGALVPFRQDGLAIGMPGSLCVAGSGQTGVLLNLKGGRGGAPLREGQAFSIITSGRRYLYFLSADFVIGSDGTLQAGIFPMLRALHLDGDVCEFEAPKLQGSLSGNEAAWTRMTAPWCDFGTITVTEDE